MKKINIPYFDVIFEKISSSDEDIIESFGTHIHWGFWKDPKNAILNPKEYKKAAGRLVISMLEKGTFV